MKRGLGLDHFLEGEAFQQFHEYSQESHDPNSLYYMLGSLEGWDKFTEEILSVRALAKETHEVQIHDHHGGMGLIIIPLVINNEVLGTFENRNLICLDEPDLSWHAALIEEHGLDVDKYHHALSQVPVVSWEQIFHVVGLVQIMLQLFEEQIEQTQEIRRLKEIAEAANENKSHFMGMVAHELKNPMTSVKGYLAILHAQIQGELTTTQNNFVERIQTNIDHIENIMSDLSHISQMETGHLQLDRQPVPLQDVVAEIVRVLELQIQEKGQMVRVDIGMNLPAVFADPYRLSQILLNLISNAHKYTPHQGQIEVMAHTCQNDDGNLMVRVMIKDNGLGIRPEEQDKIFKKFFRAEDQEARQSKGTGLGLNITKDLIEGHGGDIWFESEFRQGTTFYFTLPTVTE